MTADRALRFAEHARAYSELDSPFALTWTKGKCGGKGWQHTMPCEPGYAAGRAAEWARQGKNLALVAGPSLVVVLDEDGGNAEIEEGLFPDGLPVTPTVRARRGRQIYFRDPGGLRHAEVEGFELRVGANLCVLPPSLHPSTGREYAWLPGRAPWDVPVALLPERVVDFFPKARRPVATIHPGDFGRFGRRRFGEDEVGTSYGVAVLSDECEVVSLSRRPGRNRQLNFSAWRLGQLVAEGHVDEDAAVSLLKRAAQRAGLGGREIDRTIASGMSAGIAGRETTR